MKNFLQVNRALVAEKKHLLLNQLFGTEGSPNQTDETLTRENRIGLKSYLRRTLMLLFAVLVMSVANIGMAWGTDFDITVDQIRTLPTRAGFVKLTDGSNCTTSSGKLQVANNKTGTFTIESTVPSVYKIKSIAFTLSRNRTSSQFTCTDGGSITGSNTSHTFTPTSSSPVGSASFSLDNLSAGGGTNITFVVTMTTEETVTVETLHTFSLADGVYSFTSSAGTTKINLTDVGTYAGTISSSMIQFDQSSSKSYGLKVAAKSGYDLSFVSIYYYDCSRDPKVSADVSTYTKASYTWIPSSTATNVTLTFDTENAHNIRIYRIYVGYVTAAPKDYTVTAATSTGTDSYGTVEADASSLDEGETTTITATPAAGYQVSNWAVSGTGASISPSGDSHSNTTTLTMGTANATVTATFEKVYASGSYTFDGNNTLGGVTCGTGTDSDFRIDNIFFSGSTYEYEGTAGGDGDNFKGWKWKTANATIKFFVENDCDITIGLGSVGDGGGATITYTQKDGTAKNNISLTAATNNKVDVKGGTLVTVAHNNSTKTVTLKKIIIEDAASLDKWYLHGNFDDVNAAWTDTEIADGATNAGYVDLDLDANTTYSFTVKHVTGGNTYWSRNGGTWTRYHNNEEWPFTSAKGDCSLRTDIAGIYRVAFRYHESTPKITVTYPTGVLVTLDYNYSSLSEPWQAISGEPMPTPPTPTRDSYAFVGWYTTSACTTPVNFDAPITEATTIYAKWDPAWKFVGSLNWSNYITMTRSSNQMYWYYTCTGGSTCEFILYCGSTAYYRQNIQKEYNGTNITNMNDGNDASWNVGNNCAVYVASGTYYIIVYPANTAANQTNSPIICASTVLPNDESFYSFIGGAHKIYFDNTSTNWSTINFRVGRSNHSHAPGMTRVKGTDNLYECTPDNYQNYFVYQVANNSSWQGDNNSIYQMRPGSYDISEATVFQRQNIFEDITLTPGEEHNTDGGVKYLNVTQTRGMKTDRVTISPYENGTITVNYVNTSNSAATLTSGSADLAHTVILTSITAEPATGYEIDDEITINGEDYSANYVVTGPTTIAASFKKSNYTITHNSATNGTYTISVAGGSAESTNTTANYGQTITLAASPSTGYALSAWNVTKTSGGATVVMVTENTFAMPAEAVTISPVFAKIPVSSITLNKTSTTLTVGGTETLTATVSPANALDKAVNWTSSDGTVATVDGGVVTAVAAGTATITATAHDGSGQTATCTVTVNAAATLYTVTFNSNGGSSVDAITQGSAGANITMPAAPTYADHTFQGWVIGGTTYAAGASYTPTANITAYASWKETCAGGGGGGATLFSQNFNSATEVAYEADIERTYKVGGTTLSGLVGSSANLFNFVGCDKKGSCGIGVNSETGANSKSYAGKFGAYANNTSYKWALKTADLSATAPTAVKVTFDALLAVVDNGTSKQAVTVILGNGFEQNTSQPAANKTYTGFTFYTGSSSSKKHAISKVGSTTLLSASEKIDYNTEKSFTWVVNNTGSNLDYTDPNGETQTLATGTWDLWMGTTLLIDGTNRQTGSSTFSGSVIKQLYIGSPNGVKHEFLIDNIVVTDLTPAGGGCFYVTYDGNGADGGSVTDAVAHASGSNVTVLGNTDTPAAFTKTGYRFNGWNTSATGNGISYAAGATISSISADVTLYAQWVADACSAPSAPTISGTSVRTAGQTITLNAVCATGADASTTYTWYKGVDWATAFAATPVQAELTAEEGGRIFNKASCASGDAGTYWCEASNGDGCESHNATGFTVTVNDAVATHIYYYKDADHYSDDTYSNPEGNTAASGDNKSLSSPWKICNGCMTGVDSVVAHGATYDGKGNYMNAYIKLPTGGTATTKNIKFALTAGYTGTLTVKIGGYSSNPTVTLQPLNTSTGVLGDAITPTSGSVGGVATTENPGGSTGEGSYNSLTWSLSTAGGTYILTVSSANAYISQIDMTTATTATFSVTYDGNGKTGGTVPATANHEAGTTVTVAANTGDGKLVKENYTGAGWNTANNGTGTNYVPGSGTFTINANTTLYAHWTQLITLAPGTQGTGTNNAAVSWNGSVLRGFTAHTASGYALQGYYTEPTGGTKVLNADGSFAATNIDGFVTSGKWSNTGAAPTLYAQWEASNLLKWNLKVNVAETSITTLSKESAAPTVIAVANMGNLTNNGSLTITDNAKSGLTSKIATTASATGDDAGKYMSVQFIVAAGYQLVPSDIKVKVQPISHSQTTKLILEDNNLQSISYTSGSLSKGSTHTVTMTNSEEVAFTGTVTLKIYVYGTAESDGYRLGTPIEINGSVEETCTPPTFDGISYSATEYTVGASASPISVTGATNVDSYKWKYNIVNDRTSGTDYGTESSVTPSTASTGTLYYWCELKNGCTTVKTAAVGITVRNATTDPTVTWSNVKLGATDNVTPNYGGGNYVLRATVNETSWTGTLAASMITAPAGITIHHVTTGKADNKNYIEFKFDVTTAFDRASNATIDFNIALPEVGSYSAYNSVKSVTYNDCSGGAAGQVAIKMGATASTSKSNPQNYWETAGAGRLMFNYGSNMGSTNNSSGYETADSTFYYYAASTGQKWMFQTYIGGVNKVRVVFRAAGTIKSSKATITNFYYNTEYFASPGSNAVSFGEVSASKAGYSSGEDGYIEFTVPEMAANSYGAFVTADGNMKVYGVVLYSENAGSGGSVATNPAWSDSKADGFTVNKTQSDPNFTYTISTTTNTLGAISYSSSKPSVAAVDPVTGEVTITATGASAQSATITATLARSGCYQGATRTYTVQVTGLSCSDVAGTITTEDLGCDGIKMTLSGYTEGATIQWYKDGATIDDDGDEANVYTTTAAGRYYAVTHKDCNRTSNTVEVAGSSVSATREVSKWYIKNGRLTPDIKLWTLGKGTHLESVAWSSANGTGLTGAEDIYERDGAVWLTGREPNTNSGEDVSYTLTLTVNNGCSVTTEMSDPSQQITIVHQKNTDKHVLAFVVGNTEKDNKKYVAIGKGFTESIPASQTTQVSLYNAIAAQFAVQPTNIYSTDDEQKIKEYYSQFDIICITDYPNTQTKGANSKSYVDAIGALIDIRPILTMEAFVSALPNWKLKGVSGNPQSPSTRQYTMLLQCKDHEIFSGTKLTKVGEGEDAMYRVTMVDKNQEEYKTLDANYGDGEHKANEGYQYGKKPALQGFTYTEEMSNNNMLPLGLIDDGAGNDLQVGIERQHEMSARMMVLGINSYAMERLTDDGKTIVINALKYLMKKNAEDISDCSVYFDGSDKSDPTNWDNELNWGPNYASLPLYNQEVRILKPCVVKDGTVARASGIKIIPSGRINHNTDNASGSLTIEPGGALIVDGEVRAATAPNYFNAYPTTPGNLVLQSNSSAQAALILDNSKGETQATVEMYNPSHWDTETYTKYWSYVGVPIEDVNIGEYFYNAFTYLHTETEGWIKKGMYTQLHPFEGIGLSMQAGNKETFYGTLASTEDREIALTCTPASPGRNGKNIIGNSWTAPIQIANFEASDFGSAYANIWIFNTGTEKTGAVAATTENDGAATAGQWLAIPISVAGLAEYTGLKVIPAMQAFEVNTTAATTLNLNYDRLVRGVGKGGITPSMNMTEPMRAPRRSITQTDKPANSIEAMLRVRVSDSKTHTDVYLMQDGRFTDEFDNGWEAAYIYGDNRSPMLYAKSEIGIMSFLAKPDIEGTVLGFFHGREDDHTFSFSYTGSDVLYLNDLKLQTSTLISDENTYSFKWVKGDSAFRFVISRTPLGAPGIATGVTDLDAAAPKVQKIIYNDKLYIIRGGKVFSADGQLVK